MPRPLLIRTAIGLKVGPEGDLLNCLLKVMQDFILAFKAEVAEMQ